MGASGYLTGYANLPQKAQRQNRLVNMASTITIICPECEKSIKAPEDVVGKKIRCKGCGETFTAKAPKSAKPKPAAKQPAKAKSGEEEEEGAYGLTEEYLGARCPECANPMEDDDVVCLECGYSTVTRQKPKPRKVAETTGGDVFLWLLPGILCVLLIIFLIAITLTYILAIDEETYGAEEWYSFLGGKGVKVWLTVMNLFFSFLAGRFAVKRLILDNQPPEIEEKWEDEK
jgi:hypothetical protein